MIAFAANSLFCRLALYDNSIDASSFTIVRFGSGALTLLIILRLRAGSAFRATIGHQASWPAAFALALYAIGFSFAYRSLDVGTGALILFAAVQVTMITAGLIAGERPRLIEWLGILLALGGFLYLVLPGVSAPPLLGALFMTAAGVGWGVYSLFGRRSRDVVASTTANFVRSLVFIAPLALAWLVGYRWTSLGLTWALLSGVFASGMGYVIWYAALKGLTATRAAVVQLSVPVIAALAGVAFLSEVFTLRLFIASVMILGGIGLAVATRRRS